MHDRSQLNVDASGLRIGIAVSEYHREITQSMRQAAVEAFTKAGGRESDLLVATAAGSFELTAICRALAILETRTGRPALDALVAIGCIIAGETTHDQFITQSVMQGLTSITVETGIPIGLGVLTCQTMEQARARSVDASRTRGGLNKGAEAMSAAIQSARTIGSLRALKGVR